jgi:hypothetical protein
MAQRELGKFSERPLIELQHVEKAYPAGHLVGEEIRAEIRRRQTIKDQRSNSNIVFLSLGIVILIVTLILVAYAVIYRH